MEKRRDTRQDNDKNMAEMTGNQSKSPYPPLPFHSDCSSSTLLRCKYWFLSTDLTIHFVRCHCDEKEATTCSLDSTLVTITEDSAAWHSSLSSSLSSRNDLKSALDAFTQLNPWHLHQAIEEQQEGPVMVGWKKLMENVHGMNGGWWWWS